MSVGGAAFLRRQHDVRRSILDLGVAARLASAFLVGVVGFCGPWHHSWRPDAEQVTARALGALFDQAPSGHRTWCVSGATATGVSGVAYRAARDRDLRCVGVAPLEAAQYPLAELDRLVVVGDRFGDESSVFVHSCDAFWMLGGGTQAEAEMRLASALGKPIVVVRGLGGRADALTPGDLPTATFLAIDDLADPTARGSAGAGRAARIDRQA